MGVWLVLLAVGCGEKRFSECSDTSCRTKTVKAAYAEGPQQVLTYLSSTKDTIEQAALVDLLVHDYPNDARTICAVVPRGSLASERCNKLELRPHLYKTGEAMPEPIARTAPGPDSGLLPLLRMDPPWPSPDLDDVRGDCDPKDITCLGDRAHENAAEGRPVIAGQLCTLAWPEGTSARDECFFQVAEKIVNAKGPAMAGAAVATCAQAGSFARQCLQHAMVVAQPIPPPADKVDAASVDVMKAQIEELRELLPSAQREEMIDYAWSVWTRDAYRQATAVNGTLLDALPPEAAPHVRVAAALRLGEIYPQVFTDMDAAAAKLKAHLDLRPGLVAEAVKTDLVPVDRVSGTQLRQGWMVDSTAAEGGIPATWCLGAGRRTVGQNENDDLRIAVLEGAARLQSPPAPEFFLGVVGTNQVERVRWTAARLASDLYPMNARAVAESDPSELVRAALLSLRDRPNGP